MSVPNFHVLRIKYLGPTNTRGSRVKVTSDRFNDSFSVPFNHKFNNSEDIAAEALEARGFRVVGMADGYVITDTFLPFKERPCAKCKTKSNHLSGNDLCVPCVKEWIKNR